MASHPGPPPSDDLNSGTDHENSFAEEAGLGSQVPVADQNVPRDVLVALTYGLELARHGAMLVAEGGRPHLANRAAMTILQKEDGLMLAPSGLVADRTSQHDLHDSCRRVCTREARGPWPISGWRIA